jgi:RNA polymerase sigma-70 factor (ECF subfamily)
MAGQSIGVEPGSGQSAWLALLLSRELSREFSREVSRVSHLADSAGSIPVDEALLARVAGGDEVAFASLLDRHLDPIHGYLLRMTRSVADAEDLSQETFLRVWQKATSFQPGRVKVSTWIHTIAHHLCIDAFRRQRETLRKTTDEPEDTSSDPERLLAASQQQYRLLTAIGRLPDSQRSALLLCQMQGFSNAEAAHIAGIKVRALESLLARARRTLRTALMKNGPD